MPYPELMLCSYVRFSMKVWSRIDVGDRFEQNMFVMA